MNPVFVFLICGALYGHPELCVGKVIGVQEKINNGVSCDQMIAAAHDTDPGAIAICGFTTDPLPGDAVKP